MSEWVEENEEEDLKCRECTRKVKYNDEVGYEDDDCNDFVRDANGLICLDCLRLQTSNEEERYYNNMLGDDVFLRYRAYQFIQNEWHNLSAQFKSKLENEIRTRETMQDPTCWYLIKNLCRLDAVKIAKQKNK